MSCSCACSPGTKCACTGCGNCDHHNMIPRRETAEMLMNMIETSGRANGPGLWLAAVTIDPSLRD